LNSENDAEEADGSHTSAADKTEQRDDANVDDEAEDDGGFGDDFDDFEEGGEGDDFGDFDDGFQQGEEQTETTFDEPPDHPSVPAPSPGPVSQNMQSHIDYALMHESCSDECGLTWDMCSRSWISRNLGHLKKLYMQRSLTLMKFTHP
jgi:cobalamin biosynthesis protein CobT